MPARIINTHDTEANWYSHNRVLEEGSLISISEINPTEHDIECNVESENLVPLPFVNQPAEKYGVKFKYENGTVIATGTATRNFLIDFLPADTAIEAGDYQISGCPQIRGCYIQAYFDGEGGPVDKGYGASFTVKDKLTRLMMQINSGVTVNGAIFEPKLQRRLDLSTVKVDVLGANLIPFPFREDPSNYKGVTFSYNNGTITATGTATDTIYLNLVPLDFILKKGNYSISGSPNIKGCLIQPYYDGAWGKLDDGDGAVFEVKNELTKVIVQINKDTVLNNTIFKPMLNVGTKILPFEPYKKKTYSSDSDGVVKGIKSAPPIMNFYTANTNVILRVGYENWSGFIPKVGEQVIFLPDVGHASPRIKIGDGKTGINELPFTTDTSLTITGAAADAGKVGEKILALEADQKKYLPLTGGSITGQISKSTNTAGWYNARDLSLIKGTNSDNGHFFPILSSKTLNGSFEVGGYKDRLLISYVTDADYNTNANKHTYAYFDENCILHGVTTAIGTPTLKMYAEENNRVNFGGTGTDDTIYFGTQERDGRVRPATYIFGSNASATIKAKEFIGTAINVGNSTMKIYPMASNEINFGGTATGDIICFGTRSMDNRPRPTVYSFGPQSSATIEAKIFSGTATKVSKSWILDNVYPIGSIYINYSATSPASMFGGEWERLSDRFLIGAGNKYGSGYTGGEETHTLTISEMPKHRHGILGRNNSGSSHAEYGFLSESGLSLYSAGHCDYTGSGAAHNNMPPYLGVYMWRRIK